jgi:hypothetical protein
VDNRNKALEALHLFSGGGSRKGARIVTDWQHFDESIRGEPPPDSMAQVPFGL